MKLIDSGESSIDCVALIPNSPKPLPTALYPFNVNTYLPIRCQYVRCLFTANCSLPPSFSFLSAQLETLSVNDTLLHTPAENVHKHIFEDKPGSSQKVIPAFYRLTFTTYCINNPRPSEDSVFKTISTQSTIW